MTDLYGLVIAGGKSTRMGTDKGSLIYHSENQVNHVYSLLKSYCSEVFVSCNAEQDFKLPCIKDNIEVNLTGPALGLISAFNSYKKSWLVIAIDFPYISKLDIQHLIDCRDHSKKASVYKNNQGFFEPCFGIYEYSIYSELLSNKLRLNSSLQQLLKDSDVRIVKPLYDNSLINVNDREVYLKIKQELG